MSNRQWKYSVTLAPRDDNRDTNRQQQYEVESTNAQRAINKAKKQAIEDHGGVPTDYQALDATRTNAKRSE